MTILEPTYYTLKDLEEKLGVSSSRLIELIAEGKLAAYARLQYIPPDHSPWHKLDERKYFIAQIKNITWLSGSDNNLFCEHESTTDAEEESYIGLEDIRIKSTELERLQSPNCTVAKLSEQETDKELSERLKLAGVTKEKIAQELKRVFPTITPSRIGRLTTESPGITVTTDAYRKRGIRLLK